MNIAKQLRLNVDYFIDTGSIVHQKVRLGNTRALFRMRNACIDKVFRDYEYSQPIELFYPKIIKDIATCQDRANHYGVGVGGTIREYKQARPDFMSKKALKLREIRKVAIDIGLIELILTNSST